MTEQGRYVYVVEERSGRGRCFVRLVRSTHDEKADAEAAIIKWNGLRPATGWNNHRYLITRQWQEADKGFSALLDLIGGLG